MYLVSLNLMVYHHPIQMGHMGLRMPGDREAPGVGCAVAELLSLGGCPGRALQLLAMKDMLR